MARQPSPMTGLLLEFRAGREFDPEFLLDAEFRAALRQLCGEVRLHARCR